MGNAASSSGSPQPSNNASQASAHVNSKQGCPDEDCNNSSGREITVADRLGELDFDATGDEIVQILGPEHLKGKTVLITGGTQGIGKETARVLTRMGATVVITCRRKEDGDTAVEEIKQSTGSQLVESIVLDLSSNASVRSCAAEFKARFAQLHVLVCNAGVMGLPPMLTPEGREMHFQVNYLGHFLLVNLLLDLLLASKPCRVVCVSSAIHKMFGDINFQNLDWESLRYNHWTAYAVSKAALCLFVVELDRRFHHLGLSSFAVHPGLVRTNQQNNLSMQFLVNAFFMLGFTICKSVAEGASTSVLCVADPYLASMSGNYFEHCHQAAAHPNAVDPETAIDLWQVSCSFTGLEYVPFVPQTVPTAAPLKPAATMKTPHVLEKNPFAEEAVDEVKTE